MNDYLDLVFKDAQGVFGNDFWNIDEFKKTMLSNNDYVKHVFEELNGKTNNVNEKDVDAFYAKVQNTKLKALAPNYSNKIEKQDQAQKQQQKDIKEGKQLVEDQKLEPMSMNFDESELIPKSESTQVQFNLPFIYTPEAEERKEKLAIEKKNTEDQNKINTYFKSIQKKEEKKKDPKKEKVESIANGEITYKTSDPNLIVPEYKDNILNLVPGDVNKNEALITTLNDLGLDVNTDFNFYKSKSAPTDRDGNEMLKIGGAKYKSYNQVLTETITDALNTEEGREILSIYNAVQSKNIEANIVNETEKWVKENNPKDSEAQVADKVNLSITKNMALSADNLTSSYMEEQYNNIRPVLDNLKIERTKRTSSVKKRAEEIFKGKDWPKTNEGWQAALMEANEQTPLSEKEKALFAEHSKNLNKFMAEGVIPLVDANGGWISEARTDKDFLEKQQIQKQQIVELGLLSLDAKTDMLFNYETEMLSLINNIKQYGIENVVSDASMAQRIASFYDSMTEGDGSLNTIEGKINMITSGDKNKTMGLLPPLPSGSPFTDQYNELLQKYVTMSAAVTLNYDPLSMPKSSFGDGEGFFDELAQGFVDMAPETFDVFDIDANEAANIFAQELQSQGYTLDAKEQERIDQGVGEMVGNSLPALIKMGVEIYATSVMLGPVGGVEALSAGMGRLATRGILKATGSRSVARSVGTFMNMYAHESIGLIGSNYIGANMTHSEGMPVYTFALGSTLGRMGLTKIIASKGAGIDKWWNTVSNSKTYAGGVARTLNHLNTVVPMGGISVTAKRFGEAGIGTLSIKGGEGVSGGIDVLKGEITFDEFWHHTTDAKSFASLFGGLITMGMFGKPGMKEMYRAVKLDINTMQGGKRWAEWNRNAEFLGLNKIKKIPKNAQPGQYGEGITSWSKGEIMAAKDIKIKEINENKDLDTKQKAEAIELIEKTAKGLEIKSELDNIYANEGIYDSFFSSKDNLRTQFERVTSRFREGKISEVDQDIIANFAHDFGKDYVSLRIQEASGMGKVDADNFVNASIQASRATTDRGFGVNSPYRAKYLETEMVDRQITQKRKAVKEFDQMNDGEKAREFEKLDKLAEQNKLKQEELANKQREFNKEKAEADKKKFDKETIIEVKEDQTVDDVLRELNPGQKVEETGAKFLDFGAQVVDNRPNSKTKGKSIIIVDPKLIDRVFTGSLKQLYEGNRGAVGTIIHEAIHPLTSRYTDVNILAAQLKENNPKLNNAEARKLAKEKKDAFVTDFIEILKSSGEYEAVLARVKGNAGYRNDKLTDEWFSVYGEMVNRGELEFSKSKRNKFKNFGKKAADFLNTSKPGLKASWESGKDVYDWITAFAGGKGREANEIYKRGVKEYEDLVKNYDLSKPLRNSVDRDAKGVMAKLYNDITDYRSKVNAEGADPVEVANEANKAWKDGGANKFIDRIYRDGTLDRLIMSKIPSIKPPGWLKEFVIDPMTGREVNAGDLEFKQSVFVELINHIKNFKVNKQTKSAEDGLFAWINSQLSNKIGEVYKKGNVGTKEVYDITYEQATEAGQQIAGEMEAVVKEVEAKKPSQLYKELNIDKATASKLERDVIDIDYKKMSDISKKGGKNQRISPFMRDFKKQAGDKLGKTIYEDVFNKGKNIDYIKNNYVEIVKNLNEGYLSKNFPELIEKRVDGNYTSDWQGKKIDVIGAEKGFTSGPEYMRLRPDFESELNKDYFVSKFSNEAFASASNPSSARAAKYKGLAYQMGDKIAITKFKQEVDAGVTIKEKIFKLQEDLINLDANLQKYELLKTEHPDWTASRLKMETNDVTSSNYFDKKVQLREDLLENKIEVGNYEIFEAFSEGIKKENTSPELSQQLNNSIENAMFRRNSVIRRDFPVEAQLESFVKLEQVKDILNKQEISDIKIPNKFFKRALMEAFGWDGKETVRKLTEDFTPTGKQMNKMLGDLNAGAKIFKKIKAQGDKNKQASIRFDNESLVESINIAKEAEAERIMLRELGLPETMSLKGVARMEGVREQMQNVDFKEIKNAILNAKDPLAKINNIILNRAQYTGASAGKSVERMKWYNNTAEFIDKAFKPALEAAGYEVEYDGGGMNTMIVKKDGKPISLEYRNISAQKARTFLTNKKVLNEDGSFNINREEFKEKLELQNKDAEAAQERVVDQMSFLSNEFHQGGITPLEAALAMKNLQQDMQGALRASAKLTEIWQPIEGESYILGKNIEKDNTRWEHKKPAEFMVNELARIFLGNKFIEEVSTGENTTRFELDEAGKKELEKLFDDYTIAIIPVSMDNIFEEIGFKSSDPKEIDRYYNLRSKTDPRLRQLRNLRTGEIRGSEFMSKENRQKLLQEDRSVLTNSGLFNRSSVNKKSVLEVIETTDKMDKSLDKARSVNTPVKKIRIFDFDDTLATSKSLVFYNKPNPSGKPSSKRKAIFMIGGPGSGKSNIGKGLELGREGWKVVNQDIFIEAEKSKQGLPEVEKDYDKDQRSSRAKIGAAGKKAADAKMEKYRQAGDGMVIDGTGASYNATMKKVNALKEKGYEVFMVHAKTSNEVALERNRARKERSLKDFIVEKTQKSVNENIPKYMKDLGENFMEIDTETIEYGKPLPKDFVKKVKQNVYKTERGILNAEEFAKDGKRLIDEGAAMDFSDFNIVREGERGPLFKIAEKIRDARGTEDVFVLTARAPESQQAIHEFLKSEGLDIPIENITGLGKSTGEAKAEWVLDKTSEGYNDFYFADDAIANVEAVRKVLDPIDVKSKVQQARINRNSVDLDKSFNDIIEGKTGIESFKEFSGAKAEVRGKGKGRGKFITPPSAQDFSGLMDYTLGKGTIGEAQREWYNETLYKPYSRAQRAVAADRINLMDDFRAIKKELDIPNDLREKTPSGYTKEQAVRVHLWDRLGEKIPRLTKTDLAEINDIVTSDPKLSAFADQILQITKGDGYSKPKEHWLSGTITTDFVDLLNTTKRSKYLEEWQQNVDVIFSEKNLNKLEAGFGKRYREAVENSLARMKAGKNRIQEGNRLSDRVLDYINNAQGTIMFLNMRSALLQTISSANFANLTFNNPLRMGQAFANQPQYWKDFMKIMNSSYLRDRRNGLKINISESEIADAASSSNNKAKAAINYILEKGYAPTKFADSFAIASGGATWYRNKIKSLKKEGMSEVDAEKAAFEEFVEISERSQQSSDPSKISQQQSSDMGRLLLQFVNTPMQYNRLQIADAKDLINGRGNPLEKVTRILYYGFAQNMFFNLMQQGMFALGFGDDFGDTEIENKFLDTANGMSDSILRGTGLVGMTTSVIKNLALDVYKRSKRDRPEYIDATQKLLDFSPAIKNKFSKFKNAAYQFDDPVKRSQMDDGFSLGNPAFKAFTKVVSGVTNVPLDRGLQKIENIQYAMSDDSEDWQKVAAMLGWPQWQLEGKETKDARRDELKQKIRAEKAIEDPSKYSKAQQVDILKQHGYSDEEIKALKKEENRVDAILKSQNKTNKIYTSDVKTKKQTLKQVLKEKPNLSEADKKTNDNVAKYYKMSKSEQVELLNNYWAKRDIKNKFNTEQKRVDQLLRLIEKDSIPDRLKTKEAIPTNQRTMQQRRLYKLNKKDQLDTLKSLGLSDSVIKTLRLEVDRVAKIEQLYKNKK
tara:strand:+ start:11349 stop:22193 length:10845 start_codon:yes stop_codon:yes gene_type:complete